MTSDPWRYRCPNGHCTTIRRPKNEPARRYHCEKCEDWYPYLVDVKTGEAVTSRLPRSEVPA